MSLQDMQSERQRLRSLGRRSFPQDPSEKERKSVALANQIAVQEEMKAARWVGVFSPQAWEVDLTCLLGMIGPKLLFPRVSSDQLIFHQVNSLSELEPDYAGILAPKAKSATEVRDWSPQDIVLVPGTAFSREGGRLGMGKGFYDRFLASVTVKKWGICWITQLHESLPLFPDDVKMDAVWTDAETIKVERV